MALQQASTAKTASDAAAIQVRSILTSLVMGVINAAITTESERIDVDERMYKITLTLEADVNGRTKPVEIIQSDSSRVLLSDIEAALMDAGYRVSSKPIKSSRVEVNDKVKIQIAWG